MQPTLCIHGHFYQPPREDPWLDEMLPEGSAAPYRHWNLRIARESYGPMAFARRVDGAGRITDVVNCFEWISFNIGPTLMRWLERGEPDTYARIVEGDRASVRRLGHGNAMAQVCHHIIMPLASERDKRLQVAWGIADFERRFGRRPEGMWLAEAAVDTASLEALAEAGIAFTLLAPRQAAAVRSLGDGPDTPWREVREWQLEVHEPYLARLPSGRSIAVFFYHGPLSQAVAFERLLADGENFWRRTTEHPVPGLRSLATDGETYGHHFRFGEMALAYVLEQGARGRDGWRLGNFAAHLAAHPPTKEVRLHEPSSWSCVHGVERWRSDCGCSTGDHPGWNQHWRGPLRRAVDLVSSHAAARYEEIAPALLREPRAALLDFGRVYAGSATAAAFEASAFLPALPAEERARAWKLLSMQQWALAAQASCAWFFDDIGRIEPLNSMAFALRAMDLDRAIGGAPPEERFKEILAEAVSNAATAGPPPDGRELFEREVRPRRETQASIVLQAWLRLRGEGKAPTDMHVDTHAPQASSPAAPSVSWAGVSVSLRGDGQASLHWEHEGVPEACAYTATPSENPFADLVSVKHGGGSESLRAAELPWNKRQALALAWLAAAEDCQWRSELSLAAALAPQFLPWQEAQATQTDAPRWARLFAALAWIYVTEGPERFGAPRDAATFLKGLVSTHPGTAALTTRLQEHLAWLVTDDPQSVPVFLERARDISLVPDLWLAQNAFWLNRERMPRHAGLAESLGFAD